MSVRHIVRNSLLAAVVPAAAALAVLAGPAHAEAQGVSHNPPASAEPVPTAPADAGIAHNPPAYAKPVPTAPAAGGISHNPPTY